jgi:hypothetical protein
MGNLVPMPSPDERANEESISEEPKCHLCDAFAFHICLNENCKKPHCAEHTSNVDLSMCESCSPSVQVDISKQSVKTEDYDLVTDETIYKSHEYRNVHFSGEHWLSNSAMISAMPEAKLKAALEYHKGMISTIEMEMAFRKVTKTKADLAASRSSMRGRIVSTTTKTEKTTRVKASKQTDPAEALLKLFGGNMQKVIEYLQKKV